MTRARSLFLTLSLLFGLCICSQANKLEDLTKQRNAAATELNKLKAKGLGHAHPKVKFLEKQLSELNLKIDNAKELRREIIILLEGQKSHYLTGHSRHGKTDKALTELLNAGWKIEKIIPAGTTKEIPNNKEAAELLKAAYVWLSFEG